MKDKLSTIKVEVTVHAPVTKVWKLWTTPSDISQWNIPFDHWHSPNIQNDVKDGGTFLFRMEAKDGSEGFDHAGVYDKVITNELIEYTVSDGRKSVIQFIASGDETTVIESFEPEAETPLDVQKDFCGQVLNKFKLYVEAGE